MAKVVSTAYVDDLDGSEASGPVDFSLDGKDYTIDLATRTQLVCAMPSPPSSPRPGERAEQAAGG